MSAERKCLDVEFLELPTRDIDAQGRARHEAAHGESDEAHVPGHGTAGGVVCGTITRNAPGTTLKRAGVRPRTSPSIASTCDGRVRTRSFFASMNVRVGQQSLAVEQERRVGFRSVDDCCVAGRVKREVTAIERRLRREWV